MKMYDLTLRNKEKVTVQLVGQYLVEIREDNLSPRVWNREGRMIGSSFMGDHQYSDPYAIDNLKVITAYVAVYTDGTVSDPKLVEPKGSNVYSIHEIFEVFQ